MYLLKRPSICRSRLGWAGADARAATAELDAKHAEQNAKHAVKELTAAKAVTDVLREKLEVRPRCTA